MSRCRTRPLPNSATGRASATLTSRSASSCSESSFFFQAEDGIRDVAVTGVQTCALPIFGNGRGSIISRPGDGGDNNNNRAWVANLYSRPTKLYGLQMGVSVYRDKITLPIVSPAGNEFREWISAAHIVWTKETPEFLAEFANVNHKNILTNATTNNQPYSVQVGYRLPRLEKTLKPHYAFRR